MPQVSEKTQEAIIQYADYILEEHNKHTDYFNKMEQIDIAYARYITNIDPKTGLPTGEGIDAATTPVGVFNVPSTTPPVVVSQVESMVGYLSEVFLSGTPLFPVVSSPANQENAGALEALLDDHANLGGYPRELLIFLRDAVKYNLAAVEADWTSVDQYNVLDELAAPEQPKINQKAVKYTKIKRLDLYNTIWDRNTDPGDISKDGDYAGYIKILSRPKLKRLLNKLSIDGDAMNVEKALASFIQTDAPHYRLHPQISDYVASRKPTSDINWRLFLGEKDIDTALAGNYDVLTIYGRLCPADIGITAPKKNTPQIFKFIIVNSSIVICAKRIISAYDCLPILFGQPFEDGLGYQTKSIAEGSIPIQDAAKTLFAIRFNSARRAVSDRALYNPSVINPKDVNAPVPAAKIPVNTNSLAGRPISDFYHPIPFDSRGTESAIQDGMQIVGFGKELSGLNNPMQGQFQKGNKSVQEWQDTMGGADARLRLPALALEYQFFSPLKEILKFNIYQYGNDAIVISQKTGDVVTVDIQKLRQSVLSFHVADGYTPKSKLASTQAITQIMQMISQSPILQQAYGVMLPGMISHLAQLMGVRGLNEYIPQQPQQQQQQGSSAAPSLANDAINQIRKQDLNQQELDLRQQALQIRSRALGQQS